MSRILQQPSNILGKVILMKARLECYICLLGQALSAAHEAGADEETQRRIFMHALSELQNFAPSSTPAIIADTMHRIAREETRINDPYRKKKERCTQEALALYPQMQEVIKQSEDPIEIAIRLAIAGNIIDLALLDTYDLLDSIDQVLKQPLSINHIPALKKALLKAPWVLFLADNAGETVFDRLLIEQIAPLQVKYIVKSGPASNDAIEEDAISAGIDQVADIFSNGYDSPGIVFDKSSEEFLQLYKEAPLIISKGMGNYESLSIYEKRMFFLMKVKCTVIAHNIGTEVGGCVVYQGSQ